MSPSGAAHRLGTLEKARAAVLEEVERQLKERVLATTQGFGGGGFLSAPNGQQVHMAIATF